MKPPCPWHGLPAGECGTGRADAAVSAGLLRAWFSLTQGTLDRRLAVR
jgi:hypothetical protein